MNYTIDKPDDFIKFILDDFFAKEGFEPVNHKGEAVWRHGVGFLVAPSYLKVRFGGGQLQIEAWIKSFGEHSLDGFYGAIPKGQLRSKVNALLALLYQNVPAPQPAYAGVPVFAAPDFSASSAQPVSGPYPPPIPVAVHNPTSQATISLVAGLLSILGILIPVVGVVGGITAICTGIRGRKSTSKGMATAGLVLGIVFTVVGGITWVLYLLASVAPF